MSKYEDKAKATFYSLIGIIVILIYLLIKTHLL